MGSGVKDPDWAFRIASGRVGDGFKVLKFGRNAAVTNAAYAPVCLGGIYQTPQVSAAEPLRVRAGNTNDSSGGSGARSVSLQGLNSAGNLINLEVATAGTSAGPSSSESFIRFFRGYVEDSGVYATYLAGSHAADIIIEGATSGNVYGTISVTDFPRSQTEIGAYTIPKGYVGYVYSALSTVASSKIANLLFFQRQNILQTAAPYSAMRIVFETDAQSGRNLINPYFPIGPFPELTDIGFMAKMQSGGANGEVSVNFEILLVEKKN